MKTARPGSRKTNSKFPGVLGVSACHERRRLFVTYLNESDFVGAFSECFHDTIDAIAWQTKDHLNSPIVNGINQNVGCGGFHGSPLFNLDFVGQ
jgi:hypothetical protein